MSASKSKELAVVEPSRQAIARRYMDHIAASPLDIRKGQAVFVDGHGVPYGRKKFDRMVFGYKVGVFGALIGGGVLAISGALLPGAALYLVGVSPMLVAKYRGTSTLMHVDLLARQGQLEEAQRRLDAVPELRKRNPAMYLRMAGNLASHRGEYEAAIGYWREACAKTKGLGRELLNLSIAKALLLSGKVGEGKLMVENLRFPPEADEVLTGQLLAKVMVALHERDAAPSHDELHGWASTALAYSHTGVELAAIGWGFERAGDEEMAQLLASEAKERMHYPYLATRWPALQAWLDARGSAPPA